MRFDEIVDVLKRAFGLELTVIEGTTAFDVASKDDATKVQVVLQDMHDLKKVLISADIGEPPPEGMETLLRTMMEANNLFSRTAGATLSLDGVTGRFRLQVYEPQDDMGDNPTARMETFIETALFWKRTIEDYRSSPSDDAPHEPSWRDSGMIMV